MLYRWVSTTKRPCSSCWLLDGQVHKLEDWYEAGLFPGSPINVCDGNCKCKLIEENKEPETQEDLGKIKEEIIKMIKDSKEAEKNSEKTHVQLSAQVTTGGQFEIACITAGEGNGWEFGAAALKASLALWDGVECFMDHSWDGRSIKDLAGIIYSPAWDETLQGITAKLRPVGPGGTIISELGSAMLGPEPKPEVGFSADVLFTALGNQVTKILKVMSVDLVMDPARGGAFLRALNSKMHRDNSLREETMSEEEKAALAAQAAKATNTPLNTAGSSTGGGNAAEMEKDAAAIQQLLNVQQQQFAMATEAEKVQAVRAQMCEYLLTSGIASSKLPAAAADRVRKQFSGKVFEPAELTSAIDDARALVSELTGGMVVNGPSHIHGMFTSDDQVRAAVDDLLGAERDADLKGLKAAKLSGIRELYMMLTGDVDLHGGYHPEHARLASTSDFSGLVKNALNKMVVARWNELGQAGYDWWKAIATVEHFNSLNTITGTLVGTVGALPAVAEGGEYTELAIGDSPETGTFTKYGGYIPMTMELIDRDETRKLRAYPGELAAAGLRKISALVAAIFTANGAIGPTLADTGALFNSTAVTTRGGHANLGTTALTAAQWEVVGAAIYNQPLLVKQDVGYYGTGPQMALNPRYCLVPRALRMVAQKILYPSWENTVNIHSENQQQGQVGDVVVVPDWTDVNDWAAVVDPRLSPAIFIGERFGLMPEIFIAGDELSPAVFTNDESRMKVRHFLAV
jgi:hypothetical protein